MDSYLSDLVPPMSSFAEVFDGLLLVTVHWY